jgi:hypothetical protein
VFAAGSILRSGRKFKLAPEKTRIFGAQVLERLGQLLAGSQALLGCG